MVVAGDDAHPQNWIKAFGPIRANGSGVSGATSLIRRSTNRPETLAAAKHNGVVLALVEDGELNIAIEWRGRYRLPHEPLYASRGRRL